MFNFFCAVDLHSGVGDGEQPAAAQRDVSLVQGHADTVQPERAGGVAAQPQTGRVRHSGAAGRAGGDCATAPGRQEDGRRCRQRRQHVLQTYSSTGACLWCIVYSV